MRLKSELYKSEQEAIIEKIITIIKLDDQNSITLYELENDKQKIDNILNLIPEIRKYFAFKSISGADLPENSKRPYISIIRQTIRSRYNFSRKDCRISTNGETIRTIRYTIIKKEIAIV